MKRESGFAITIKGWIPLTGTLAENAALLSSIADADQKHDAAAIVSLMSVDADGLTVKQTSRQREDGSAPATSPAGSEASAKAMPADDGKPIPAFLKKPAA